MKFLIDVHVSRTLARALADRDHDVVEAALNYPMSADEELLAIAIREHRVIVTQDSDFSDLVFAFDAPAPLGIVFIRCRPRDQIDLVGRVLEIVENARLHGHMVVIKPNNTRYRRLPEPEEDHA
ncbi:DUF5615 family PIN-like protein [Sphingomonas bacterium]|uniref:DUF5615 family PIN-like protein n=1 Tax=Sphingomonas bacterium TaxID=1895847 RepID=UPI0015760BA9|nr:DUF5615 family PIN-like protein [Sphingomonas bacterium]